MMTLALDALWIAAALIAACTFLIAFFRYSQVRFFSFLLLAFVPLTQLSVPIDARILMAAPLALEILRSQGALGRSNPMVRSAFGLTVLATVSLLWSTSPSRTLLVAFSWLLLAASVPIFSQSLGRLQIARIASIVAGSLVGASWLVGIAGVPFAYSGGRLQGVFANPNALGVTAALCAPLLFVWPRSWIRILSIPILTWVVVFTASRGSAAAAVVGVSVAATAKMTRLNRVLTIVIVAAIASLSYPFVIQWVAPFMENPLLRTNDSRGELWGQVLAVHQQHPWLGIGGGALDLVGGNSYLKFLAEYGYFGIPFAFAYMLSAFRHSRQTAAMSGLLLSGLASAVVESWLFAAGSGLCVLFFSVLAAQTPGDERDSVKASKRSGVPVHRLDASIRPAAIRSKGTRTEREGERR